MHLMLVDNYIILAFQKKKKKVEFQIDRNAIWLLQRSLKLIQQI